MAINTSSSFAAGTIVSLLVCLQLFLFFGSASTQVDALYIKEERNANAAVSQICGQSMPCGWEVYREVNKQTRTSNYFVYSPCRCQDNFKCARDSDDVSINSYVHRCKPSGGRDDNLQK